MNGPTAVKLAEAFRRFDADDAVVAAVLTGAEGAFCAGADLKVVSQGLLEPVAVELTPAQAAILQEHLTALSELGFDIEPFGGRSYLVRSIPAILSEAMAGK